MTGKLLMINFEQWSREEFRSIDLHTAASIGLLEKVQEIVENVDFKGINLGNKHGWTPLMYAICSGDVRVVHYLLKMGANPNQTHRNCPTPLVVATKWGDLQAATALVENGADINAKDFTGWSVIFYASAYGHHSILQMLIAKGSDINQSDLEEGMTPLMLAAAAGHELIVKYLLQCGANLLASAKNGATALSLAIKNGHTKVKHVIDAHLFHKQDYIPSMLKSQASHSSPSNLRELIDALGLSKYYPILESHNIDLTKFYTLTDEDLKEMGIRLLGPRKKIANAIAKWKQSNLSAQNKSTATAVSTKAIGPEI